MKVSCQSTVRRCGCGGLAGLSMRRQGLLITEGNILRLGSEHPITLLLFRIAELVPLWLAASALTAKLRRP